MIIGNINNGIVLDHIEAGKCMEIYEVLKLNELECTVAMIKNADSVKMGKKDIIKIFEVIDLDLDVIGYMAPTTTVNIIENGKVASRKHLQLPEKVEDVITCKNPRCITSVERGLKQSFKLTNREKGIYRCIYCESEAK
ncbi:MAG: aspartate carbamoyltransferase regulatory subunit [Anaerofustis stercorihominis]|nr:aspartate carbamoyltransferase regulatory subunit [Anaerofustis stercorihominis]